MRGKIFPVFTSTKLICLSGVRIYWQASHLLPHGAFQAVHLGVPVYRQASYLLPICVFKIVVMHSPWRTFILPGVVLATKTPFKMLQCVRPGLCFFLAGVVFACPTCFFPKCCNAFALAYVCTARRRTCNKNGFQNVTIRSPWPLFLFAKCRFCSPTFCLHG